MKLYFKISIILFLTISCNEEDCPPCQNELGNIEYPIIAHSHNDYDQEFPLITAIDHGFTSLEVDVFYDGEKLKVSHDEKNLSEKPEFVQSYLIPLTADSLGENGLILLVDIKNYSTELIDVLNNILKSYSSKLASRSQPNDITNKIKIILSGEYPRELVLNESRYEHIFIDGRFNETDIKASSELVPIISLDITNYSNSDVFNKDLLREIINHVHDNNKLIRFWKTNDKEHVWLSLIDLDVDIIGVDNIEKFCAVMKKNNLVK